MTTFIDSLEEILDEFDVAVLDQWGVLHNGSAPYPHAIETIEMLRRNGKPIVIVSNSGKRADLNAERIRNIGLPIGSDTIVVTSGESLWNDLQEGRLIVRGETPQTFYVICAEVEDAVRWAAESVGVRFEFDDGVDAVLVMGLKDDTSDSYQKVLRTALSRGLPLICSNPDKSSPRSDGMVTSPGVLAERYEQMGGTVVWYGKPHTAIYESVLRAFAEVPRDRFLMVGDSLEHDIAGAATMNFCSALIQGGIHQHEFASGTHEETLVSLLQTYACLPPKFCLKLFR